MKLIPLTRGAWAKVSDGDFLDVGRFAWFLREDGYAARCEYLGGGRKNTKSRTIFMHRYLMGAKKGELIDHKDGDKLNNQRFNLRRATKQQNGINHRKYRECTSKFNGVHWRENRKRWVARVQLNGKQVTIGHFKNERFAAMAYDLWTLDINGEYANPNLSVVKYGKVGEGA